jgi:hypothetical protein
MNENFNGAPNNEPVNDIKNTEKKPDSHSGKSKWLGGAARVGAAALVGMGVYGMREMADEQEAFNKSPEGVAQIANEKAEIEKNREENHRINLGAYYAYVKSYPDAEFPGISPLHQHALARAIEIANNKKIQINLTDGGYQDVSVVNMVNNIIPVEINVNGQVIPLSTNDYTPEELKIVRSYSEKTGYPDPLEKK